jgi:thiol-disulfide isomerase/thioredoxin
MIRFVCSQVFSLALAAMLAAVPSVAQDLGLPVGSTAPIATLEGLDGKSVDLGDAIGKKPVVLEFWATWCANCKELEPAFLAAHRKYGDRVAFFGIAVPINQTLERVKRYTTEHQYPFPMLWDRRGDYAGAFDVPATSYVVVIDKTGKIVYTGIGGKQNLDAAIQKAL